VLYQNGKYVFRLQNGTYHLLEYGVSLEQIDLYNLESRIGILPDDFKNEEGPLENYQETPWS
jgi:hypothetical protein